MGLKFNNNGYGTLGAGITDVQTTITLSLGQGERFPEYPNGNDYSYITIQSLSNPGDVEVMRVTGRNGDVLTVERGASDEHPAKAFVAGDYVYLGLPAEAVRDLFQIDSSPAPGTFSGPFLWLTAKTRTEFGEVVYMAPDFEAGKADADVAASLPGFYMCVEPNGVNAGERGRYLESGTVTNSAWNWTGGTVYLSLNEGELTQTPPSADGQFVQPIGVAISTSTINFKPSFIVIETKTA
ncbi:hypothetical protein [Maridesulfovibrio sp.]|uniref:hypothetical protein n=1 Tax=Maridesulfovibrio sp. TaxID=2795000 RepID=UPI0029CA84C2|nr:hypothetical protein [Maridesulfovibrio sp.]